MVVLSLCSNNQLKDVLFVYDGELAEGDLAYIGIGYVSGANDFFHLRPSQVDRWRVPRKFLHASVRNGSCTVSFATD
jgi:hypothetical protein